MVEQFTCDTDCNISDTSLLILFKPLSSDAGGTRSGSFLASDMWQIHFTKVQVAVEARIRGLAGGISLGMPICPICV